MGDSALAVDILAALINTLGLVNSSELRAAGFDLREVIPLQLEAAARGGQRTRGAALKQIHSMGIRRYVLSVDNDNEFRSRCE